MGAPLLGAKWLPPPSRYHEFVACEESALRLLSKTIRTNKPCSLLFLTGLEVRDLGILAGNGAIPQSTGLGKFGPSCRS
jgi:hypothetical protein